MSEEYIPKQAIINYTSKNGEEHYLESHDIWRNKEGNYVLLEGKTMKLKTIQNLAYALTKQNTTPLYSKGLLPDNLIYFNQSFGSNIIAWFVPSSKHPLFFTKDLNIPSGQVYSPALLFILNGETLSVFAMKENKNPDNCTQLYHAPFHNIYRDGEVCLGNAKKPNPKLNCFDEIITAWENAFWTSEFSHLIQESPVKSNLNTLYKRLIKSQEKFPLDELLPHTKYTTVEKLLNQII